MYNKLLLFLIPTLFTLSASAEYRAYQYYVTSKYKTPYDTGSYLVTSSLDPVSYISYNGGQDSISIELLKTWMCKGNTAHQEVCPSPSSDKNIQ